MRLTQLILLQQQTHFDLVKQAFAKTTCFCRETDNNADMEAEELIKIAERKS